LAGFDEALRQNLLSSEVGPPEIHIAPGLDAPLVVEVLNACSGSGCQLVSNATLSLPMDSGLRERFQVVVRIALDGIDYAPHVSSMGTQLRRGLFAEFRTRKASPEELVSWLKGSDPLYLEAAIRSVAARKVVEAGPQIAGLISAREERVALLGIAAAGVLATRELLAPLKKAAMGLNPNIADAAIQAIADIGTAEAVSTLKEIEQNGATEPVRARARALQGASEDKLSPSSPNSDKHD